VRDKFTIPAVMSGFTPLKDGSLSLRFTSNIPSPEERGEILNMFSRYGILVFFDKDQLSEADKSFLEGVGEADAEFGETKSMSQRLRNVLFLLHKQDGGDNESFKTYYQQQMERLINHFKSRIDE
jgi:hypothetical protein